MKDTSPDYKVNNVSNEAVEKATGKTWPEWFKVLDQGHADKMPHKEIAEWLYEHHLKLGWWCQMITVGYEQERGLRQVHEKTDGFGISASKTIPVSLSKLYDAWADEHKRKQWLKEDIEPSSQTENKYFNAAWTDDTSRLRVGFYAQGDNKAQVAIEHAKLASSKEAEKFKKFWHEKLNDLASFLEE